MRAQGRPHKPPLCMQGHRRDAVAQPALAIMSSLSTSDPPPGETHSAPARASDQARHAITWLSPSLPPSDSSEKVAAWPPRRARWAVALERLALAVERPVNRLAGIQFNPLYHTGTIAFYLLIIVGLTGLYLFFFFQYGFDASPAAVARMESQLIARTVRAVHRYASGATVIVTLLHAYRMLFLEKFRGPRWLAWLTGVVLTAVVWLAGITGYWLIWDERAVLINDTFRRVLDALTPWNPAFMAYLSDAGRTGRSWILFLVILAVHVILFVIAVVFFYLHIVRLKRPKWLPPMPWVVGIGALMLLGGLFFPAGLLPSGDLLRLPEQITIDPIFLFFLPYPGARWVWLALLGLSLGIAALPWLARGRGAPRDAVTVASGPAAFPPAHPDAPRVRILTDRCTGCTLCALDCPYGALEMVERADGQPHKYVARAIVERCVSCAICVGSCDVLAVTLGAAQPEDLWSLLADRVPAPPDSLPSAPAVELDPKQLEGASVIFTCERHAAHGARPYLDGRRASATGPAVFIALPCVGALPPDLIGRALEAGATSVRVVGCPPDDCANREGNTWAAQRLTRQRLPRLRRPFVDRPVLADWLPPDAFDRALDRPASSAEPDTADYVASRGMGGAFTLRRFAPALALVALALLAQILLTDVPMRAYPDRPAVVQWVTPDLGAAFGGLTAADMSDTRYRVEVRIDGQEVHRRSFDADALLGKSAEDRAVFFHELTLSPGQHALSLRLIGEPTGAVVVLFDEDVTIGAGEVFQPSLALDDAIPCTGRGACAQ